MKKWSVLIYGIFCYLCFLGTFLYLACWLANLFVPNAIDAPSRIGWPQALLVNGSLVLMFGLQHSIMARPTFKRWWTRFVFRPIERSTYVMCTNVALWILFWQWQPIGGEIWNVQHPVGQILIHSLCVFGWLTVLITTFMINHFDLFGLRQVWLYFRGKPYTNLKFRIPGPYLLVRHPLYVGWMIAFWATPTMTVAHLVFAVGMSVYVLIAIPFEERNLTELHGEKYSAYQRQVAMLIPQLSHLQSRESVTQHV